MHRFFIKSAQNQSEQLIITGQDVKHIKNVLRMKLDDKIEIVKDGNSYVCSIHSIENDKVIVKILFKNDKSNESPLKIHLYQSLPKSTKMETILQKCTELGVFSFHPIITERSIVKIDEKKEIKKLERWESIVLEAAKQSKRDLLPEIHPIQRFKEALNGLENKLIIVPYELENNFGIKDFLQSINIIDEVCVFIGPEGGFEEEEIDDLVEIGAQIVSLGPRILRTETAGFITCGVVQYELGDIGVI
ncbi:MAG: 16S rRNA (uracil(1498)-N(3))-methyltransferase [Gudongella sp.]|nr:16S rRNA (uracil(1498)-N(3))-methyltransferase [Gudongella sp.]